MLYSRPNEVEFDRLLDRLKAELKGGQYEAAKAVIENLQTVDRALLISNLPQPLLAFAFRLLTKDEAIEIYEYLDTDTQENLLKQFQSEELLEIIQEMSPDDRADLFDELPAKVVKRLLEQLSPEERQVTAQLLGYLPETAGRLMTPEYISLRQEFTVQQALEQVRREAPRVETIYVIYVTDDSRHLCGVVSLRDLFIAELDQNLWEVMTPQVIFVTTDTDQEEVAKVIERYDILSVPVVDREKRLVGIITVDDVIDIIEQEATEDIYTQGAVEPSKEDDYFDVNLITVTRRRAIWLLVLLITNTGTAAVISSQEDILEKVVALAAFIPLLIDSGGNVGGQSSTVIIRGFNTSRVVSMGAGRLILREAIAGAMLGACMATVVFIWSYFMEGSVRISFTVATSLLVISTLASTSGSALPFLFKRMGLDPALMSAPFITTIVDVLGVFVYLQIARQVIDLS
ncbi:MAG: magnesium transporter [Prochloraceae cyanobacterium]